VTAHSAVQAAKDAACARRRSGLRQFVANAPAAERKRVGGIAGLPHFAPKAKRVIYLFQNGAPTHVDLFDYKPEFADFGVGRQFGVMADEVERFVPEAVTIGAHGYRSVNYARLGITRQ